MPNPRGNIATLTPYSPKWRSGATQTVRIPIALVDRVMAYARALDSGESESAGKLEPETLSQVLQNLEFLLETPRNNFSRDRRELLRSTLEELKSLVTSDKVQIPE